MSKYFQFNWSSGDVTPIREYLETVGKVNCTDDELARLWRIYSSVYHIPSTSWLMPDPAVSGNLPDFAHWLYEYDEEVD
jgi:hypothetical protein